MNPEGMERRRETGGKGGSDNRQERAEALFRQGFSCAQSVFGAMADRYGLEENLALRLSCALGGGVGRLREICGAVTGMALVCGLESGNAEPGNREAKDRNYREMRELAEAFRRESGSLSCRELLGLPEGEAGGEPAERTEAYYASRPCLGLVRLAVQILEERYGK